LNNYGIYSKKPEELASAKYFDTEAPTLSLDIIDPTYKSDYIKSNYIPYRCIPTLIIDIYKTPLKRLYNIDLDYNTYKEIISPDPFRLPLEFFKQYKINLYIYTLNGSDLMIYEKIINEPINHRIPSSLHILLNNRHIYHFRSDAINSISQKEFKQFEAERKPNKPIDYPLATSWRYTPKFGTLQSLEYADILRNSPDSEIFALREENILSTTTPRLFDILPTLEKATKKEKISINRITD